MTKIVIVCAITCLLLVGVGEINAEDSNLYLAEGRLSYYEFNPWYGTIKWRQQPGLPGHLDLPSDEVIARYGGTIAVESCDTIGWHGYLTVSSEMSTERVSVLVVDCAGADAILPSGNTWLEDWGFAGEMGYELYSKHPEWYNNPEYHAELVVWPSDH